MDLNGHSYTYTGTETAFDIAVSQKTFTIKDSSEAGGGKLIAAETAISAILIPSDVTNSKIIVGKGATIEGKCVLIGGKDCKLDVYGTISTKNSNAAIQTNGASTKNSTINLYDGAVVSAQGHAIYHPGTGTLNIYEGATVNGGNVGIEMRAGTLNVYEGARITGGMGTPSSFANTNGTTTSNTAVAVAQHKTAESIQINIMGGTLTGGAALYESNPQQNDEQDIKKVVLQVSGGTFLGSIYSEDVTKFITNGTFDEEVPVDYCTEGSQGEWNGTSFEVHTHSWGEPKWVWENDYSKATATFVCQADNSHKEVLAAGATAKVKTPATCTQKGITTYSVEVKLGDIVYSDTKDAANIPILAHHYVNGVCTECGAKDPASSDIPQTGDATNNFLWIAGLYASFAGMLSIIALRKKFSQED